MDEWPETLPPTPTSAFEAHLLFGDLLRVGEQPPDWPPIERRVLRAQVLAAHTFYWSPDLNELIESAAASLPLTTIITKQRLFTRTGFCWFGQALNIPGELQGPIAREKTKVLVWGPITNRNDESEYVGISRIGLAGEISHVVWPFGKSIKGAGVGVHNFTPETPVSDLECERTLCLFGAMMLFMEQRILMQAEERPSRAARRRVASPDAARIVHVVMLRRPAGNQRARNEHGAVDWACRWIVSGHWRQQWYPAVQAHQPIWIAPYVKGPAGKAVRVPRRPIFAVAR